MDSDIAALYGGEILSNAAAPCVINKSVTPFIAEGAPLPPTQFTFELKEIKEEDEEVFEDSEEEEEQPKQDQEKETDLKEKVKEVRRADYRVSIAINDLIFISLIVFQGAEDEKGKEKVLLNIPVKPIKSKEELAKEKEERLRLKKEKKRLEREKEKELPPLVKLSNEQIVEVFDRLPEERRMALTEGKSFPPLPPFAPRKIKGRVAH